MIMLGMQNSREKWIMKMHINFNKKTGAPSPAESTVDTDLAAEYGHWSQRIYGDFSSGTQSSIGKYISTRGSSDLAPVSSAIAGNAQSFLNNVSASNNQATTINVESFSGVDWAIDSGKKNIKQRQHSQRAPSRN